MIETQGSCSKCHKVWTLETKQGVCQWCGKLGTLQTTPTHALRTLKSSGRRRQKQVPVHGNGYDQLDGRWLLRYKVASRFAHKAMIDDREDLLHDIIYHLAKVERNNGHKPFTEAMMYRIASHVKDHYWYGLRERTLGLDCQHCSKAQRHKCKEDNLYSGCRKAIKLESLNKPILDEDGNLTEMGDLIADDKALDLDAWVSESTWELGYPKKQVDIAYKLKAGFPLTEYDRLYLARYRKREQIKLL